MTGPAGEALRRAICANFAKLVVESLESRSWASVTFSGERHRIVLRLGGRDAAAAFLDGLGERVFELGGHILADIVLVADERDGETVRLTLEALTVEAD